MLIELILTAVNFDVYISVRIVIAICGLVEYSAEN